VETRGAFLNNAGALVTNFAWLGRGFFGRCGSRILRGFEGKRRGAEPPLREWFHRLLRGKGGPMRGLAGFCVDGSWVLGILYV
jgi:hypothetical protein